VTDYKPGTKHYATPTALPTGARPKPKPADPNDPYGGLAGKDRDAAVALTKTFESYGLGSLAPVIIGFLKQGYQQDTINLLLQDTDEYKKRFAGNDARLKAGLPVLSPVEYLSTEASYRDVMRQAGLPVGFYDHPDDFAKFIGSDVSPTELKGRVDSASDLINLADPKALDAFKQWYGMGKADVVAYALDPKRAEPLIQKQLQAAQNAGAAAGQGVNIDKATAERLAAQGINTDQARQGFGQVADSSERLNTLSDIYGDGVTQNDLISSVFDDNADSTNKVKRLASKERAAFNGSGGQSSSSLSRDKSGSI
jgi:hypothetical protein